MASALSDREGDPGHGLRVGSATFVRVSVALLLAAAVTFGVLYSAQPLLPHFTAEYGVSPALASLTVSLSTAALAVGLLVAGGLSDRLGRKPVMLASVLISSLLALAAAAAPSFGLLLLIRALTGFSLAGLPAVAMTYLGEEVEGSSLGLAVGLYVSGNSIGGMGGRLLVGVLTDAAGARVALAGIGVMALVLSILFAVLLPRQRRFRRPAGGSAPGRALLRPLRDPGQVLLFAEAGLLMGGFVSLYNYLGFRLLAPPYGFSEAAVGAIFLVYLAGTASSTLAGRFADRYGRRRVLAPAVAIMGVGVAVTLLPPAWLIVAGLAVATFGFFGAHSIASGWVSSRGAAFRAQATAGYLVCYYLGSSVGGTSAGFFWHVLAWPGVVAFVSALVCAGLLVGVYLWRATRPGARLAVASARG